VIRQITAASEARILSGKVATGEPLEPWSGIVTAARAAADTQLIVKALSPFATEGLSVVLTIRTAFRLGRLLEVLWVNSRLGSLLAAPTSFSVPVVRTPWFGALTCLHQNLLPS